MLQNERKINENNLLNFAYNMLLAYMDKIEGKTVGYVDLSTDESTAKQPQMVCLTITPFIPK